MQEGIDMRLRDVLIIAALTAVIFVVCYAMTSTVVGWMTDAAGAYDLLY
jgi:hypothetical protein